MLLAAVEFDLQGKISFELGDTLGVYARNDRDHVREFLNDYGL